MKKLMRKRVGIGSAGLSLIELIISIAILAVVGTAVGGAMYVSSRSYTRGSAEVNVQEEAQIASNLICDWLIDATNVDPDGMGEDPHNPSGPDIFLGVQTVDLSISGNVFTITHPDSDLGEVKVEIYMDGSDLKYKLEDGTTGVLASNVSKAVFNSTFGKDRNVNFSIDFAVNDRTYHAVTDSTSRNHEFIATSGDASTTPFIEYSIPKVNGEVIAILEPGQENIPGGHNATFSFKATVKNALSAADGTTTFNVDAPSRNNTSISVTPSTDPGESNVWIITVSASRDAVLDSIYTFTATNTYNDITIAPKSSSSTVTIKIRRDNECEFYTNPLKAGSYSQLPADYWNPTTGEAGKAGSTYDTQIELGVQNGNQIFGAPYDSLTFGYKDPGAVSYFFYMGSYNVTNYVEVTQQVNNCTYYSNGANAGRAATSPVLSLKLKQDLPEDLYIYVVAPHSGSLEISGAGIDVDANNKATELLLSEYTYGYGRINPPTNVAYYDVIRIKKGAGFSPFSDVGGGIRRGAPATSIAKWAANPTESEANIQQAIMNNEDILNAYRVANHRADDYVVSWNDINNNAVYCTVMYYRYHDEDKCDAGAFEDSDYTNYFVLNNTNNLAGICSDVKSVRLREKAASLFELSHAYDVKVEMKVKVGGQIFNLGQTTGSVSAALPYYYDSTTGFFSTKTYDGSDSAHFLSYSRGTSYSNGSSMGWNNCLNIPVYVDSVIYPYSLKYELQVWDSTQSKYVSVENQNNYFAQMDRWSQYPFTLGGVNYTEVKISDTIKWDLAQYVENDPAYSGCNVQIISIKNGALEAGKNYRIAYKTTYSEAQTCNPGSICTLNSEGSVSNFHDIDYELYDDTTGAGYLYIKATN